MGPSADQGVPDPGVAVSDNGFRAQRCGEPPVEEQGHRGTGASGPGRRPGSARPAGCASGMLRRGSHRRAVPRRLRQAQRPQLLDRHPQRPVPGGQRPDQLPGLVVDAQLHEIVQHSARAQHPFCCVPGVDQGRLAPPRAGRQRGIHPGRREHRQHGRDQCGHPFPLPADTAGPGDISATMHRLAAVHARSSGPGVRRIAHHDAGGATGQFRPAGGGRVRCRTVGPDGSALGTVVADLGGQHLGLGPGGHPELGQHSGHVVLDGFSRRRTSARRSAGWSGPGRSARGRRVPAR